MIPPGERLPSLGVRPVDSLRAIQTIADTVSPDRAADVLRTGAEVALPNGYPFISDTAVCLQATTAYLARRGCNNKIVNKVRVHGVGTTGICTGLQLVYPNDEVESLPDLAISLVTSSALLHTAQPLIGQTLVSPEGLYEVPEGQEITHVPLSELSPSTQIGHPVLEVQVPVRDIATIAFRRLRRSDPELD